jgi:OmcA/MtrC family decaheme c-type cytochrome
MIPSLLKSIGRRWTMAVATLLVAGPALAQTTAPPPAWGHAGQFKYNIENIRVNSAGAGAWTVKVIFSVSDPTRPGYFWDIKKELPFQSGNANLILDIGWDPAGDFTNTGSANVALTPLTPTILGSGAAMPLQFRGLQANTPTPTTNPASLCGAVPGDCPGITSNFNRYWIQRTVTPVRFIQNVAAGRVAIEGHPVCNDLDGSLVGCPTTIAPFANIPVRSQTADFTFDASTTPVSAMVTTNLRRQVVDFEGKCTKCHNGIRLSGTGTPIPRLSLHGNNRNENLNLCVMCHNPNNTDVPYRVITADARTSGPETSIDFKRMVHSIHAGGFKTQPLVVIGFNTSINDFSDVRFPATLRNCTNCHIDNGSKGTFELPLPDSVPGTTVNTRSTYAVVAGATRTIDVDPRNDRKITPIAATCSGCHDKAEVQSHMVRTGGASFSVLQKDIGVAVKERCVSCHGAGKEESVRRAHEIRSSGSTGSSNRDDD